MGNSSTKESRPRSSSSSLRPTISPSPLGGGSSNSPRRGSRHDLSFLGIRQHEDREPQPGVLRVRETKQEREARKLERERIAREKERERSMKEEGVDGGYLVTLGVYTGVEDYSKPVVRQLMIERRLAPFWRGLNDFSESWVEHQLVAAGRGQSIPAADEIPPDYEASLASKSSPRASDTNVNSLTVPISSRSHSFNSSTSNLPLPSQPTVPEHPSASLPVPTSSSSPFRPRSKTLATLTSLSKGNSSSDMTQREVTLPKDPFINGQHIEAYLYKDASECPICFLYYPPYLNKTRCCDQPICSECFVQIKRPDPHPPEHGESSPPPSSADNTASQVDSELVSEAATCPYCNQPDFGVSYEPPPFRRGLVYAQAGGRSIANVMSAMSSSSSLSSSGGVPSGGGRRRAHSLSATDPSVITTDKVRPDWASKLATARAQQARRAAAATALHTAAYLMGPNSEGRSGGAFSRRSVFMPRRGDSPESGSGTPRHIPASNLSALLAMSERRGSGTNPLDRQESQGEGSPGQPDITNPRRRTRIDDLEDMMMMEAIRMSLASEEERRKREEKEAKKEAKRKEKEAKKAEKVARKTGLYASGNESNSTIERSSASGSKSEAKGKTVDRTGAGTPPVVPWAPPSEESSSNGTSFLAEGATTPQEHLSIRRAQLQPSEPIQMPASPSRPSHLRHVSNASSTSSIGESAQGTPQFGVNISGSNSSFTASASNSATNLTPAYDGSGASSTPLGTSAGGGAGVEPMFNFRSLAAMIGEEEKSSEGATHVEHAEPDRQNGESVEIGEKSNVEGSSSKTEEPAMKDETVEKIKEAPEDGPSSSTVNGEVEAEKVAVDHASEDSSTTEMVGANGKHKEGISVTDARAEDSLAVHEV